MSTHPFGVEAFPGRLHVAGEVDLAVAATLLDAILVAGLSGQARDLVVDLAEVTFLDSTGIAVLVQASRRLADMQVHLRLANPSPFVARVMDISGVGELLGLRATATAD